MNPGNWRKRRVLRALVFLIGFPLALIPAEWVAARVKGAGPARHDTMTGEYMPIRLEPHFSGEVSGLRFSTNAYGFRGSEDFSVSPPAGERRVLALGDSVGFGWGIDLKDHYTRVLEDQLNAAGAENRWRVVNAAGQGYSPSSYHAYLSHEGLRFEPDVVLVQIELCNDVTDEALLVWEGEDASGGPAAVRGGRYAVAWDGNLLGTIGSGYPPDRTYTYTLLLKRLLRTWWHWRPRGVFAQAPAPPYFHLGFDRPLLTRERIEQGWQRTFAALAATRSLLEERQIPMLLLIIPSRYVFESKELPKTKQAGEFLQRAETLARQSSIPYLNPYRELEEAGGALLYLDFAHPGIQGNQVIGHALFDRLQR